jgi:trimeric autotransporter adhesin
MKKLLCFPLPVLAVSVLTAHATLNFSDNFDGYATGNLVGQGSWLQTGTVATSPVQVNNGQVVIGTGQDVYAPLATPINITVGSTFYIGLTATFTAAQVAGDYFLHFTPIVGDSSIFSERLFAKSSGTGFVFGYTAASGSANYSSSVLNFNTPYRLVLAYTSVAGTLNDTFALYVDPADPAVAGNNTPFFTSGYVATSGTESTTVAAINLRQGSAANAPSLTVDNLTVGTDFAEVAPVPEPSTAALIGGLGLLGLYLAKRRRN